VISGKAYNANVVYVVPCTLWLTSWQNIKWIRPCWINVHAGLCWLVWVWGCWTSVAMLLSRTKMKNPDRETSIQNKTYPGVFNRGPTNSIYFSVYSLWFNFTFSIRRD